MAQQDIRVTFNVQDSEGVRAPLTIYMTYDNTQTVAALVTAIEALRVLAKATTDGQIIGAGVSLELAGEAAPGNFADSDVSQVAVLDFPNTASRIANVTIPAFADAAIVVGHINLADTGVAAFVTALDANSGALLMTDRNWLRTGALKDAFLGTRKHRKSLKRGSFELA
jgi:hypothetical protein